MFSNKDQIDTFLFEWLKYEGLMTFNAELPEYLSLVLK